MKNHIKQLFLLGALVASCSQANPLSKLNTSQSNQSISAHLKAQNKSTSWFVYSVPAPPNTGQMCCYQHKGKTGCDLNGENNGYTVTDKQNLGDTENVHLFVKQANGQPQRIIAVGDHCPVTGEGIHVTELTDVTAHDSIRWLSQAMNQSNANPNQAMMALSFHGDAEAADALHQAALKQSSKNSEQATFWLGQRHHDGFAHLDSLLTELPHGKVRQSLNFALSQNHDPKAGKLLRQIATHDADKEQQTEAIFWLSQVRGMDDLNDFLLGLIHDSDDQEIQEKAVFSLSQIDTSEAHQALAQLVEKHPDTYVREQALFWLAQTDAHLAQTSALAILNSTQRKQAEKEQAVFALSQLPGKQGEDALFSLIKGNHSKAIKKQALFWLSQSGSEETINKLSELL